MTRFLSEALHGQEPYFRRGLANLERANGNPSADIRLTLEVKALAGDKLRQLGLDPRDTTPKEAYEALKEKLKADDKDLVKNLRTLAATHISAEADPLDGLSEALKHLPDSKRCFSLKLARLRRILKAVPPKKAAKNLGYRSVDSMLKHESPVLVLAVAWLSESHAWQKHYLDQYKHLNPSDFEDRNIVILSRGSQRWQEFSQSVVAREKHNVLCLKEVGALVLLPLPKDLPPGAMIASLSLALNELNAIRALSSYLKLNQVKAHFGSTVAHLIDDEPILSSQLLDQPMPWHLIQHYYAELKNYFRSDLIESYVNLEDMVWHPIEQSLASIEPKLEFWQGSAHCCILHGGQPLSFNVLDNALNLCNARSFETRVSHYFKKSLWHELMLRYLNYQPLKQTLVSELEQY
jgi:hypothetical protein